MEKVRLGDIATVITKGTTPTSLGYDFVDSGVNFIKIESITEDGNFIKDKFAYISEECNKKLGRSQLQKNDILFSIAGAIGRVAIVDNCILPANTNQALAIIRIPNGIYEYSFLKYILASPMIIRQFEKQKQGVAQINLSLKNIGDFEVPVLSIEEQKRIVYELDKVSDLINKRKLQLSKLDELVKSRFVEMFGDINLALQKENWIAISQIGTVVGGSTPKTNVPQYWNGKYRWISPAELKTDSGIIYDSVKKITEAGIDSCSLRELPIGTVILSSRAPIGKVAIAGNTFYCNQGFKNIICNNKILPRYLYTLLLFNTEYLNKLGRGATFKEISKAIVENIRIPVPPIELQTQFADFVEQVDKSKLEVQKSLEKLELLKKALMQKYFE